MNAAADIKAAHDDVAQSIWQAYVVTVGAALPNGVAAEMAELVIADLGLAVERRGDAPGKRLVGKWETE